MVADFYCTEGELNIKPKEIKDLYTLYKYTRDCETTFAASFFVVEINNHLVGFIIALKTHKDFRK
jgi:hypothetical protein